MDEIKVEPSKLKILIVDDESANLMLLTKMLATKGYSNVVSTLNSNEALSFCQNQIFDVVLLDIHMPELNGYEVLEQLRKIDGCAKTQIIAISGDAYPEDIKKGLDSGFSDYITKPLRLNSLFDTIDKVIVKMVGWLNAKPPSLII